MTASLTFTARELEQMRKAQDSHMMDMCYIQRYSAAYTSGERIATYTDDATPTECGLDMNPGREDHRQDMTTVTWDATLRIPITTTIDQKDRIKIVERHGESLADPIVYRIESPIQRGSSGIRVRLKRVDV